MMNIANCLIPMLGLLLCFAVMVMRGVNTKGAICMAKLNLYAVGWIILLWADWGTSHLPVFATVLFRLIMLVNNLLYIKQLTINKPIRFKTLWHYKHKH